MMSVVTQPTDQEIRSCHVMYRVFCSWGKLKIDIPISAMKLYDMPLIGGGSRDKAHRVVV